MSDKPTARSYSASSVSQKAQGPLAWGDKCFLCGKEIGETDPRGFYTGVNGNAMMLAHRGCLNTFEAHGNTWPGQPTTLGPNPANAPDTAADAADSVPQYIPPETPQSFAGTAIRFDSFEHLQDFIVKRGPIPAGVRVWLGDRALRE